MNKEKLTQADYYIDKESGLMIFTEEYHLKRGYCCESGCRHCPYDYKEYGSKNRGQCPNYII